MGNRFKRGCSERCGDVPGEVVIFEGCRRVTRWWVAAGRVGATRARVRRERT